MQQTFARVAADRIRGIGTLSQAVWASRLAYPEEGGQPRLEYSSESARKRDRNHPGMVIGFTKNPDVRQP